MSKLAGRHDLATPEQLKWPLLGVAALVALTLLLVPFAMRRVATPVGEIAPVHFTPSARSIAQRDLGFADRADGGVDVLDAARGKTVAMLEPGTNGFVRGVLRALVRERQLRGVGDGGVFRLELYGDGMLTLADTRTGRTVELSGFGRTNAEAFLKLLTIGEIKP